MGVVDLSSYKVVLDETADQNKFNNLLDAIQASLNGIVNAQIDPAAAIAISKLAGAYSSYVPVWASSGTAVALGNGTIAGSYLQVGKFVHGTVTLTFGTTTTFGTGAYTLTLPVAATGSALMPVGNVAALDAGIATYIGSAQWTSGVIVQLTNLAVPIVAYTPTVPFTFGSGDGIILNFSYQAA